MLEKMLPNNILKRLIIPLWLLHNIAEASLNEFIKFKQVEYENLPSECFVPFLVPKKASQL